MNEKCACLNVKFMPVELPDGEKEERWMCLECKSIFVRERSAMCEANSNTMLGEVTPTIAKYGNKTAIECRCSNIFLKRYHLYCYKCGAKLNWSNFDVR